MPVQPAVETRRGFRPAGRSEQYERRGRQYRQENADNAQCQRERAASPEEIADKHREVYVEYVFKNCSQIISTIRPSETDFSDGLPFYDKSP